jgi:predicted DNA-binding transcriptional regulator YafY
MNDLSHPAEKLLDRFIRGEELTYPRMQSILGLSERQLRRVLDELREHDVPLQCRGRPKAFFIAAEHHRSPCRMVSLSHDEIVALGVAAQAARAALEPTPLADSLRTAFDALLSEAATQTIAIDLEAQRHQWHFGEAPSVQLDAEVFTRLRSAIESQQSVLIDYYSASSQHRSSGRKLDPYCLAVRGGSWLLVAYCHQRKEMREFSMADITRVEPCDPIRDVQAIFQIPESFDVDLYFRDRFNALAGGEVYIVRLLVEPDRAQYFRRKNYHVTQQIEREHPDGRIEVSYEVAGLDEIRSFAQGWGTGVTVIEPPELVEKMRAQATEMARRYSP